MKKIEIDFTAPTIYKIQTLQDTLNELLDILRDKGLIELEEKENGRENDEKC